MSVKVRAPAVSSSAAGAQSPSLNNRLTRAFGSTATAIINAGADVVANAPNPNPGVAPPASNLVHLLGPVASNAADLVLGPVPAPDSTPPLGSGGPTSISSEAASSSAFAPFNQGSSIEGEVERAARAPTPGPSLAAAALARRMPALQGPHGPLEGRAGLRGGAAREPGPPAQAAPARAATQQQLPGAAAGAGASGRILGRAGGHGRGFTGHPLARLRQKAMTVLTSVQYAWGACGLSSNTGRPDEFELFASPVSDLTTMEPLNPTAKCCSHCSTHCEQPETSDIEVEHFMQ